MSAGARAPAQALHGTEAVDGAAALVPGTTQAAGAARPAGSWRSVPSLSRAHLLDLQRTAGNRAAQHLVQRESPEENDLIGLGGQQPTPIQVPLFKAGDHLALVAEGQVRAPASGSAAPGGAAPAPPISAAEFGLTLKAKSVEFSASLLKGTNPLDESINQWLNLGDNVSVSSSLALFKLTADHQYKDLRKVEVGLNLGEIEIALKGTLDHTTMRTEWGRKLFGGTPFGMAAAAKVAVFDGTIKLSISLPAEDVARIYQIAAAHRRLRAMSSQTAFWTKQIHAHKQAIKQITANYLFAQPLEKINMAKQLGDHRAALRQLGKSVAANKKLGRTLVAEAIQLTKALSGALKSTIGRFIPILSALLIIQDAIKAAEVIYGLLSGKGYSFSLSAEEGGSGEGDEPGGGSAAEGEGAPGQAGEAAPAAEAEVKARENEAPGGGEGHSQATDLNPNAAQVYELLVDRTSGRVSPMTVTMLNTVVSADLDVEQMARLLAALKSTKLSGSPAKALTQVVVLAEKAARDPATVVGKAGTGSDAATAGDRKTGGDAPGGEPSGGGAEEDVTLLEQDDDVILLDEDTTYERTPATSRSREELEPKTGEQRPSAATPATSKEGVPEPPVIDPDMKEFLRRAAASGIAGYAEFDGSISYNELSVGSVFGAKVAVPVDEDVKDEEGQVLRRKTSLYGGEALIKVVAKLPEGQLDVIRSVMPAYNTYGRLVGKLAAARMTVGYRGELAAASR